MYLVLLILAIIPLQVKSIFPERVSDNDVKIANLEPNRDDIFNMTNGQIHLAAISKFIDNLDDLGLPNNPNISTQVTMPCSFGNVFLQYREYQPELDPKSSQLLDSTRSGNKWLFTTSMGDEVKLALRQHHYGLSDKPTLNYSTTQTCWPSHGFHLHTGDNHLPGQEEIGGMHLGPLCSTNEYYSVKDRQCSPCPVGTQPYWDSSLYLRKFDEQQLYNPKCGGMFEKFLNVSRKFAEIDHEPFHCRRLIERIGYRYIHRAEPEVAERINPTVVECLHRECAYDVDILLDRMLPTSPWNFKNMHIGNYHPLAPTECVAPEEDISGERGPCGRCSMFGTECRKEEYAEKKSEDDEDTCQHSRPTSVPWGLHRINFKEYKYSLPAYDNSKQRILFPENLRFEGPDLSEYWLKTREQLQHDYCFHMNYKQECLPPGEVSSPPTPKVNLPRKEIFVSAGNLSGPAYYDFYETDDCSGTPLEDIGNNTYMLDANTEYIFSRCHAATTHPFNVHNLGADPNYRGIKNTSSRVLVTGGSNKLYEWYCSSHPDVMKGVFKSMETGSRRLYELGPELHINEFGHRYRRRTSELSSASDGDEIMSQELENAIRMTQVQSRLLDEDSNDIELRRMIDTDDKQIQRKMQVQARLLGSGSEDSNRLIASAPLQDYEVSSNPLDRMIAKAPLLDTKNTENKIYLSAEVKKLALDNGWDKGERINGIEHYIDIQNSPGDCLASVMETYQNANGASYDIYKGRCYAAINSTSHNENTNFISYKIDTWHKYPPAALEFPKEWQFTHMSKPAQVLTSARSDYGFDIKRDGFVVGVTDTDSVTMRTVYRFTANKDLGEIEDWHYAMENLDNDEAMDEMPNRDKRDVIVMGVNYNFGIADKVVKWASLHVVETTGRGSEKSLCLTGFHNKVIQRVHGIAVVPLSQKDVLLDVTIDRDTLEADGEQAAKGALDEKTTKNDIGLVIASVTTSSDKVKIWLSSYNGIPMDASPTIPGSLFVDFEFKWSRYAISEHNAVHGDYLLMAVIDDNTNTVYIFDGQVDAEESFQVVNGKIFSSSDGSRYPEMEEEAAITMRVEDMYWTDDEKLIVLTQTDVVMYTRIRENRPFSLCQNQKRANEMASIVPEGYYYTLTKTCEVKTHPCASGTFQPIRGQTTCNMCPAGQFQPSEAQKSCIQCARGTFQNLDGQTECKECMPGFFSLPGSPGLGPGEHASIMLDYVCEKCPLGYFSMQKSASSCKKCENANYCDIESQIFPHAKCTPGSGDWEQKTDHLHQFCCSTENFYDPEFFDDMSLESDWRLSSNLYCVSRFKIKLRTPEEDCGDLPKLIAEAMAVQIDDEVSQNLAIVDFDNLQDEDIEDFTNSLDKLFSDDEEDAAQERLYKQVNFTIELVNNVTKQYAECELRNRDIREQNMLFDSEVEYNISSNISVSSKFSLPPGVLLDEDDSLDENKTIEELFGIESAQCYAATKVTTIHPELEECCPGYIDNNPSLMSEDGTINIKPGDDLHCITAYHTEEFDLEAYNVTDLTFNGDPQALAAGCSVVKGSYRNFYPTMDEIFECCPKAKAEVEGLDWSFWDFTYDQRLYASCFTANSIDDCYVEFRYYDETNKEDEEVTRLVEMPNQCEDMNYTHKPVNMTEDFFEPCPEGWTMEGFVDQKEIYTPLDSNDECPEGYNISDHEYQYNAIYEGECSDLGFGWEPVPFDECYDTDVWENFIDPIAFGPLRWEGVPENTPENCVLVPREDAEECLENYDDEVENECFVVNKRFTEEQMEHMFRTDNSTIMYHHEDGDYDDPILITARARLIEETFESHSQTEGYRRRLSSVAHPDMCNLHRPCMCRNKASCSKKDDVCSESNPCTCSIETTECIYIPELNITDCECSDVIKVDSPGIKRYKTQHDNSSIYSVDSLFSPLEYDLVGGKYAQNELYVVIEKSFKNLSQSDIPRGVARSSDTWSGFYDDKYLYQIQKHSTEEVLIDMKGGIDYEATRGTDEFRYCRHEFENIVPTTREITINVFNVTANDTYLEKQNATFDTVEFDAIYCSSFFPIARQTDTGEWTCSSVRECPYWEFWPKPINEYGFVETDPCLCNGIKQYGGYCIPDMAYVLPKKGELFESQIQYDIASDYFAITSGTCDEYNAEYVVDESECVEAARAVFSDGCGICPASHPYLRKFGATYYYCYSTSSGSSGACKMSNSGLPAPADGQWGLGNDNIADCTNVGTHCEFSTTRVDNHDRPLGCFYERNDRATFFNSGNCQVGVSSASQKTDIYTHKYFATDAIDGDTNTISHTKEGVGNWLQLNLEAGVRSLTGVKITNRLTNAEYAARLGEFRIEWQKTGQTSWTSCGTYTYTERGTKLFACDVVSNADIAAVRIFKTQNGYLNLAEVVILNKSCDSSDTRNAICKRPRSASAAISEFGTSFAVNVDKSIKVYDITDDKSRAVYKLVKQDAYCKGYKSLSEGAFPARLSPGDALYSPDGAQECMNRCLAQYPDSTGFYIRHDSSYKDQCRCANNCDETTSVSYSYGYDAYEIVFKPILSPIGGIVPSSTNDLTFLSGDGRTMLIHDTEQFALKVYTYTDSSWTVKADIKGKFVQQHKTKKTPIALSNDGNTIVAALNEGVAVYQKSGSEWQEKGGSPVYEIVKIGGYCNGGKSLSGGGFPARLSPGDPLYSADGAQECMNRCLAEYPGYRAFYTRNDGGYDDQCKCAVHCDSPTASHIYTGYRIHHVIPSSATVANVDVSDDGSVVAFSAGAAARVYSWSSTKWSQRGQDIDIGSPLELKSSLSVLDPKPPGLLGLCEGDCNSDSDCEGNLICFERGTSSTGVQPVPGCDGVGPSQQDYCVKPLPISKSIQFMKHYDGSAHDLYFDNDGNQCTGTSNGCSQNNMPLCSGDCDKDANCADGLYCLEHGGPLQVTGCRDPRPSQGGADYCYDPTIYEPELVVGRVALSGDGSKVAVSNPGDENIVVYAYTSLGNWKAKPLITSSARSGLIMSTNADLILACGRDVASLYKFRRGRYVHVSDSDLQANGCAMSGDSSYISLYETGSIDIQTTAQEEDVLMEEEIWVTDVDEYFKQDQYKKYSRDCPIGSIMKATSEYNFTDLSWWEDAYDRSCMCGNEMCNAYHAHDLLVGLSNDLAQDKLLTMTCASDGCVYDLIDSERWTITEEYSKDCYGAVDEVCGVYSFGRYNDKMPFEPLLGVYDENGDVKTGMFKCPYRQGMRRNDFNSDLQTADSLYIRDGDFDVAPNGMPAFCACGAAMCQYNQFCKVSDNGIGFCGNSKTEVKTKFLENSVLDQCVQIPDKILAINLEDYVSPSACVCNGKYCEQGQYCTEKRCRECVCGEGEFEYVDQQGLSTCQKISDCELGQYVSQVQTQYTDRVCSMCESGVTYSPYQNAHACEPCKVCEGAISTRCNVTHNTVCKRHCPEGEADFNGACMPICTTQQHRLPNGTCIEACDYGTYFDVDKCVDCPPNHYTVLKGKDISRQPLYAICYPHVECDLRYFFYGEFPTKSKSGQCVKRYEGYCWKRIPGNYSHDDQCIQKRKIYENDVLLAHAAEFNATDYAINNRRQYLDINSRMLQDMLEILETDRAERKINVLTMAGVSRFIEMDVSGLFKFMNQPYLDTEINNKVIRIFSRISLNSTDYFNLPEPFKVETAPSNVTQIFFTKDSLVEMDTNYKSCSNITDYYFICEN